MIITDHIETSLLYHQMQAFASVSSGPQAHHASTHPEHVYGAEKGAEQTEKSDERSGERESGKRAERGAAVRGSGTDGTVSGLNLACILANIRLQCVAMSSLMAGQTLSEAYSR